MAEKRHRNWCFTYNNYTLDTYNGLLIKLREFAKYAIVGKEVGEKGTHHLQGFVQLKDAKLLSTIKKWNNAIHWEVMLDKTGLKARDYCKKEGDFIEIGQFAEACPGKRNDIHVVKEIIAEGRGMGDVIDAVNSYQAMRCGELILKYREKARDFKPEVFWLYGETGVGKSKYCMDYYPDAWWSGKNLKWLEGYDAHEVVVVDDFRRDFCTFHELLRILDRTPYRPECKGGSRQLLAKKIIITCPMDPITLWEGRSEEDIGQLLRRIDYVLLFKEGGIWSDVKDTLVQGSVKDTTINQHDSTAQRWGGNTDPPTYIGIMPAALKIKDK